MYVAKWYTRNVRASARQPRAAVHRRFATQGAVPTLWGFLLLAGTVESTRDGDLLTAIWLAFGISACLAAIAVVTMTEGRSGRRLWLWALGSIPASLLGPLAVPLLLRRSIRGDLRDAAARGLEVSSSLKTKPGPPASVLNLVGYLAGSIAGGFAIFLGIVTLAVFGGVHEFSDHDTRVIFLISAVPAAVAVVYFTWEWVLQGPSLGRRLAVALPIATLALMAIVGAGLWLWAQHST